MDVCNIRDEFVCICFVRRTYSVIGLEIVNVLSKDEGPQVFAEKLDHVEGVVEAGSVARESVLRQAEFGS